MCIFFSHSFAALAICFGSLSSWKNHLQCSCWGKEGCFFVLDCQNGVFWVMFSISLDKHRLVELMFLNNWKSSCHLFTKLPANSPVAHSILVQVYRGCTWHPLTAFWSCPWWWISWDVWNWFCAQLGFIKQWVSIMSIHNRLTDWLIDWLINRNLFATWAQGQSAGLRIRVVGAQILISPNGMWIPYYLWGHR